METYRRSSSNNHRWTTTLFMIIFFCNFYQFSIDAAATCNEGCAAPAATANTPNKYTFKPGTLYNYNLDSAIQIYLAGADQQDTSLHVQAQVQLYAEPNCMYTLRIPQMFVFGPDKKKTKLSDDLTIQKPVRFSMSNGEIAPELCADDNDSEFGLNIKRAVISMIQSTDDPKKSYETDVFGTCPTIFSNTKAGGDTAIITKSRNLNGCGYRELIANGLVSGIFNEQSEIKSTPLLNGDYTCEQRIKNGILQGATVNEEYTYVPFSAGEAGVRTKIVTKLVAKGKPADSNANIKINAPAPRSIIFQDADQVAANENMKETIVKALRSTLDTYENNVGPRAASQFTELIRLMRYAKESDFAAIYSQVKSGTIQSKTAAGAVQQRGLIRKIFLDALFRTGTGYSVQFLASLLKSQEITDEYEKRLAYISFNLVHSMTKEALQSINKLFDGNPPKEAYLSIGNLVNKYCRKQQGGCESNEIKQISENFVKKLSNCKSENKQQENQIVAVLKGLRNTNNLVNPALDKVVNCVTNEKLSARIRVAAIQAMVANACSDKIQNTAMNTLKNRNEDSEIRIEAYLVLTHCPSGRIATELKELLDGEQVYQVGAFIQSHLASLRASTDIHRAAIRHHFAQIHSEQQFPFDFRRYSFNRELSYQMNSLGIGASIDTSLIYSQLDFLPKSVRLNLTAELFGNNWNLMEFSGRQENVNTLLEHNFGPRGLFNTESVSKFLQSIFDNYRTVITDVENRKEQFLGSLRTRRASNTREDLKQFQRLVKLGNEIYDDIDVDVSLKLFGTEMYFLSLGDNIPVNSKEFLLKANECLGKLLRHARGFEHTLEHHALFLDGKLVYPSGIGFPIKLLSQGAGVLRAEFNGKIDVEAIVREPRDMKINLKIVPSYNVELTGKLMIDGWAVATGLQVSAAVHTSTGADVDFKLIEGGQGFDLNVKAPLKKQEIFSFDHRIVFITQERGRETIQQNLKFSSPKKEFSDCFDQLYKNIGITFCGDVSITVPGNPGVAPFPLAGPNKASISLEVDSEYNFRGIYNNKNPKHQSVNFVFDTPKSEHRRRTEITVETSIDPKIFVRASVQAPYAQLSAEAGFTNTAKEISVYAQANNGPSEYLIKLGFNKLGAGGGSQQEYSPIVIYQTPSIKDDNLFGYRVTGKILVDSSKPNTRYNFKDIQLIANNDPDPFKINGWLDFDKQKISTDLALEKSFRKGTVIGTVSFSSGQINVDLTVKTNFHDLANVKVQYEMIRNEGQYKNDFTLIYGPDLESLTRRLEFMQNYKYERAAGGGGGGNSAPVTALQFKNKLRLGFLQVHLRVDGEYSKNLVTYDVEGGYAKHKLGSSLDAKLNGKTVGDYDIEFGVWINQHTVRVFADREIENGRSKFTSKLQTSFGAKFEVNGVVGHRLSKQDADITMNGVFVFAEKQDPYKITFVLLMTPTDITSNGKLMLATTELIDYQVKATRADITKGTFEVTVKDVLAGRGAFKTNTNNGQGDANAILNLKKLGRKVKLDSDFVWAKPVYNFKIDLFYDFEKDNGKKITFDTKNKVTRTSVNSENSLAVLTEKYQFDVNGEVEGQNIHNGILTGDFKLILPTQQQITGVIKREIHISMADQKTTGKIYGKLTDTMPNKKMRTLQLDGELTDGDYRAKLFNMWHKLEYVDFSGRNVVLKTSGKHLPVAGHHHYKMGGGSIEISGTMLNEPMDMQLMITEYCHEHAVYNFLAHYGKQMKFNVAGKHFLGGRSKPTTYDVKLSVDAPNTPMKLIKFESDGKFLAPQTENGMYEIQLNGQTTLNDKVIRLNTNGKGNGRHGSGSLKLQLPDLNPLALDGSYTYSVEASSDSADPNHSLESIIDNHHGQCEFNVKYGDAKEIKFTGDLRTAGANSVTFHTTLYSSATTAGDTPKNIDFYFKSSKIDNVYTTAVKLTSNTNRYSVDSIIAISETNPSVDLTIFYPTKEIKLLGGFDRLGNNKYKGKLQIQNFGQFNFNGAGEVSYQNVDNFYVKLDADSELLKLNKIHMEVTSKQGGGGGGGGSSGRGIEFKASSAGKNILSGNAEYTVKEEKGKTTLEGQGNVKLADKNRDVSFTFVKNRYEEATDKETGIFLIFTGTVGPKNVVAELKLTNRNFVIRNSVCEEREQCINFEVRSSFKQADIERLKHELLVSIDLRKLGYPYEFGLKAETERNGFIINHNLDMHLQSQDKVKYQYNVYVQSKKAGIILQLPQRTMSMEAIYATPAEVFGVYEMSVTTYTDKVKRPENNCQIGFRGDITRLTPMHIRTAGDLHFTHTAMKPMKISLTSAFNGDEQSADCKMEIDIFNDKKNAVIIAGKYSNTDRSYRGFNMTSSINVDSRGLGLTYGFTGHVALSLAKRQLSISGSGTSPTSELRMGAFAFVSGEKIQIIITGFNEDLLTIDGAYDPSKQTGNIQMIMKLLAATPITITGKFNGLTAYSFKLTRPQLLDVTGDLTVGNEAKLVIVGNGKDLYSGRVALNPAQFLASEYKVNDEEIKSFIKVAQKEFRLDTERVRTDIMQRIQKVQVSLVQQFNKIVSSFPDYSGIRTEYRQEFDTIMQELMSDKSIKEFVEFFQRIYSTVGKSIADIIEGLTESSKKIYELLNEFMKKLLQSFNTDILPALTETYNRITALLYDLYEDTVNLIVTLVERAMKALKSFEEDFTKIGKIISDIVRNVATVIQRAYDVISKEFLEFYRLLIDNIKALPGYDDIRARIDSYLASIISPENLVKILHEIRDALRDTAPTIELSDFVQQLSVYLENKIMKRESVNDIESIKTLYISFLKAIRSIFDLVYRHSSDQIGSIKSSVSGGGGAGGGASAGGSSIFGGGGDGSTGGFFSPIPYSIAAFKRLPYLSTMKFSPWNYLRNERFISIQDLLYTYRPSQFNPMKFLPPFSMYGQVIDGVTVFTFDGQYVQFSESTCSYILAQDFYNGNFSIVASVQSGQLKSITVLDKTDSIEIALNPKDGGASSGSISSTLNNKPTELPVHRNDIHAWRNYYSISVLTNYGAFVQCTVDLRICHIKINGFYYGQVRGLMGNGNSEQFDDFTLPDDKITVNYGEFVNAYRLPKTCPSQVPAQLAKDRDAIPRSQHCTELFSIDSNLRYCYVFVKSIVYRNVCDAAVQRSAGNTDEQKRAAACHIAMAYAAKCRAEMIPVEMPSECVKCSEGKYDIDDTFSVESPQQKADIVFVVDTTGAGAGTGTEIESNSYLNEIIQPLIAEIRIRSKVRDITDVRIAVIGYNKYQKYFNHYTYNGKLDIVFGGGKVKFEAIAAPTIDPPVKSGLTELDRVFNVFYAACKKIESDLGLSIDARAFRAAITFPFRAEASKAIIGVRSDVYQHSPNPIRAVGATFGGQIAKSRGITVHYIGPIPELSVAASKDAKTSKSIVGFNAKQVLTMGDATKRTNIGSTDLRRNIQYGSDLGLDITQSGYGYAFSLTNFYNFKTPKDRKTFISVIATGIAEQLLRVEVYSDCKCKLHKGLFPIETCTAVETKFSATPAKKPAAAGKG